MPRDTLSTRSAKAAVTPSEALHSGSAASTDRVESVARRTRAASRACLLVRLYLRRLWVQSSACHATGRPCARPTGHTGAQLQLLVTSTVGRRRRRQGARRCGGALARTRRFLPPPAGRAHAHAHGRTSPKAPVPIRRCLLEPQRLDTSDPKHASRDEPSFTDRQESVPRRTCGFGSVFIGLEAPARRLQVQSGAQHRM